MAKTIQVTSKIGDTFKIDRNPRLKEFNGNLLTEVAKFTIKLFRMIDVVVNVSEIV